MTTMYHVSPRVRSLAPSRWFGPDSEAQALAFAREAATAYAVAYTVWRVDSGRVRLVAKVAATERAE